jgi:hypothetical protein
VSIALATGQTTIEAYVSEVRTTLPAKGISRRSDLLMKSHQRVFYSRVPLADKARTTIELTDPWSYAELGEAVEAWGCRYMQHEHTFFDRTQIAEHWYTEEYRPIVRAIEQADLIGTSTPTEAYMRVTRERYRLMRTHEWNDEVISRLRQELG